MDTPKNAFYEIRIACIALTVIITLSLSKNLSADDKALFKALKAAYYADQNDKQPEIPLLISNLLKALPGCNDEYLLARAQYRIGILYFKDRKYLPAKNQFRQLAKQPYIPLLVKALSLNMIGQINRLSGEDDEALRVFDTLTQLLEKQYSSENLNIVEPALIKLWYATLLSQAEIFQTQEKYNQSLAQYEQAVKLLVSSEEKTAPSQIPQIYDRMSQLYFRQGNIKQYLALTGKTVVDFPDYTRTPLMKLERACVIFARDHTLPLTSVKEIYQVPARIIGNIAQVNDRNHVASFVRLMEQLYQKRQNTPQSKLLCYHYASLLDALGEKQKAAGVFSEIIGPENNQADNVHKNASPYALVDEYAKIQYAIILAEEGEYVEALKVMAGLRPHPLSSHLGKLSESVTKSIQTLKREVRSHEIK